MANSYHNMSWGSLSLNFSNTKQSTDCQLRYKIQHPSVPMADWLTEAPTDARPADVQVLYLTWYSIVGPPHPWIPHLQHESMVIWVHGIQNPQISALTVNAFLKKGRERGNMEPTDSSYWNPQCPRPCAPQQRQPPRWEAHVKRSPCEE